MSRIPDLGSRGEGWVALQAITMVLILVAGQAGPVLRVDPLGSTVVTIVGWVAIAAGTLVVAMSSVLLRRAEALTALPHPTARASLVSSGPYRFVRHPVYAGLVLGAIGIGLARQSLTTLALALVLFAILDVKRRREEAWLADRYPEYESYRSRTRALIPYVY